MSGEVEQAAEARRALGKMSVEQLEAECVAARRALRAEQAAPKVEGEPMYTWQTSQGPLTEPLRVADAVRRWTRARTAVVAARKAAETITQSAPL